MGKYFGHRTKWAGGTKGTSPFFGVAEGRPPARLDSPNPYNKSAPRSGQIIPPNRGQYPRGSSLPGYSPNKSASEAMQAFAAANRAMRRAMMMMGLLKPLTAAELAELLQDFMLSDSPVRMPAGYNIGPGWTKCPTPTGCGVGVNSWIWGSPVSCTTLAACPFTSLPGVAIGTPHATRRQLLMKTSAAGVSGFVDAQFIRDASLPTNYPSHRPARTRLPILSRPPGPEVRAKEYPNPKTDPMVKPKDRYFGPRLPPRGSTKFPDYPHAPPPAGVKEKKGLVIGAGKAGKAYGALTEFRDFADCLAASIPGNPCGRFRSQLHKYAACIASNQAAVNMPEAIACFYGAQAKDTAIGRPAGIFQRGAAKGPYWTRPVGPSAGSWAAPQAPRMTPI